ncbi:MAG: pyridoxamine 5'-phosphate oxidase [Rickettsiaceae bacterium H1]|nr:pyridoxamine 5'-phosphate oxidase [Rickettsiaceae bacterium H1]
MENPFDLFKLWYEEASSLEQYNAMSLATSDLNSMPSVRIILLKNYTEKGFIFYTNINSQKGHDLRNNPNAEILFFWKELAKQIRISGKIEQLSNNESDQYFASRTRNSQISAWLSKQSQEITDDETLEEKHKNMRKKFSNIARITRPDFWRGFILVPQKFEFWQEKNYRLHTRKQYKLIKKEWRESLLYP